MRESGKHPSELVRGITTERTLSRWISGEVARPNPFQSRQLAKRLGLPHEELFQ